MNETLAILRIVLPVLAVLLLGYLSRKKGLLSAEQVGGLKTFVVTFTLPAVMFSALYRIEYTWDMLLVALTIYAVCIAGYAAGRLVARFTGVGNGLLPFLTTGFEAGMMGYALYSMIFGAEHLSSMATVSLGGDLFVFTLYMALLKRENGLPMRSTVRETLRSPVFLALTAGVIVGATGLGARLFETAAGGVLQTVLDYLGAPTSCAILFVVGYGIEPSGAALKAAVKTGGVRLAVMAVLCAVALGVCSLLPTTDRYRLWAVVLLFTLPGPFVLPVFVRGAENERFASTCLSLYTILSVALFCVVAAVAS